MLERSVASLTAQCRDRHIIVIGDLMLDEYHWCSVSRISPEAPVPVCRVERTTLVPGGAANVAHNILSLNSKVSLCGFIGKDSSGEKLWALLKENKIASDGVIQTNTQSTILKSRIVAGQQHIVRVDRESTVPLSRAQQTQLFRHVESIIDTADALLLSDYLKGTLTDSFTQKLITLARSRKIPVIVDPKGDRYIKYKGATILTPNFSEFKAVTKKRCDSEKEILSEGIKLTKNLKLDALLVTRSEKGMSLISRGKKSDIPTLAREVFDITGAGDTAIAMLSLGIASGLTMEEASYLANAAAGIVVGKVGTSTTTLAEIKKSFSHA